MRNGSLRVQGARPPGPPPTPQCLFPEHKNGQVRAQIDSSSEVEFLATVCAVLIPTYVDVH